MGVFVTHARNGTVLNFLLLRGARVVATTTVHANFLITSVTFTRFILFRVRYIRPLDLKLSKMAWVIRIIQDLDHFDARGSK